MTVNCKFCGQEWQRDPALEVVCPKCHSPIGTKCKRPSGHDCDIHGERDAAALQTGVLEVCPGMLIDEVQLPDQFELTV